MRRSAIVATAVVLPALGLAACGSTSDKDKITAIIKGYGKEPTKLCTTFATERMIRAQFGSKANCLRAARSPGAKDPALKINSISIKGKTAHVIRTTGSNPGKGSKAEITLIKQGGTWKVQAVIPIAS
jgi:hypothetical protein